MWTRLCLKLKNLNLSRKSWIFWISSLCKNHHCILCIVLEVLYWLYYHIHHPKNRRRWNLNYRINSLCLVSSVLFFEFNYGIYQNVVKHGHLTFPNVNYKLVILIYATANISTDYFLYLIRLHNERFAGITPTSIHLALLPEQLSYFRTHESMYHYISNI